MKIAANYLATLFACLVFSTGSLSAQCIVDSLVPSVPGIYPDTLKDAVGCEYYEVDITFFLPRDTVIEVIPGQDLTVPFNFFRIDSVEGLAPGMDWACNLAPDCIYNVEPGNPAPDTLGCVQFFGTPTVPGIYQVVVHLTANATVVGNNVDQPGTYETQLYVSPCAFVGDCYTYTLSDFCEPASISLSNNLPSNGHPGYSYEWAISGPNGFQFNSTDENPADQLLPDDGMYFLNYDAVIDTFPYTLSSVEIISVECSDLLDAGDIYWILIDPAGMEVVNTSGSPISNGGDNLPINTGINIASLDSGTYEFQVWDDDIVTADDGCTDGSNGANASIFFTVPPPVIGADTITDSSLSVVFIIDHPIQFVACADSFMLDSLPAIPEIISATDSNLLCINDSLTLMVSGADSVQWYLDGDPISGANSGTYEAMEAGVYMVESINPVSGCRSGSAPFEVFIQIIQPPSIGYDGNSTLSIAGPDPAYRYDWYDIDQGFLGSGENFDPSSSGNFFAIAVDTLTGCQSDSSVTIQAILSTLNPLIDWVQDIRLYPNPADDGIELAFYMLRPEPVSLRILDIYGKEIHRQTYGNSTRHFQEYLDLSHLAKGLYLLEVSLPMGSFHQKFVLR